MKLYLAAPMAVALLMLAGPARASGPCTADILAAQEALDRIIADLAATGPTAPESEDATLSHEPTPDSLAQTEADIGDGVKPEIAQAELDKARKADEAGDNEACQKSLTKARDAIGVE